MTQWRSDTMTQWHSDSALKTVDTPHTTLLPSSDDYAEIMELTFAARRQWVVYCIPKYSEFVTKFPPLKDTGNFRDSLTAIFPNFFMAFCSDWPCEYAKLLMNL